MRGRDKKQRKQSYRQQCQQANRTQKDQAPLDKFLALLAEMGASVQAKDDKNNH